MAVSQQKWGRKWLKWGFHSHLSLLLAGNFTCQKKTPSLCSSSQIFLLTFFFLAGKVETDITREKNLWHTLVLKSQLLQKQHSCFQKLKIFKLGHSYFQKFENLKPANTLLFPKVENFPTQQTLAYKSLKNPTERSQVSKNWSFPKQHTLFQKAK